MSTSKILVIGGGVAGPVLAIFLKLKGYNPIVYERLAGVLEAGNSLLYAFHRHFLLRFTTKR